MTTSRAAGRSALAAGLVVRRAWAQVQAATAIVEAGGASELFTSAKTASVHVSNILRKVGASTRGEAAAIADERGIVGEG